MLYKKIIKRIIDFVVSLILCMLLLPVFLIIILLLFVTNNGHPFFIQKRPGKYGRLFKIFKFKTMNDKKDNEGNLLADQYRLTAAGKIIRKLSLDETLQLFNVLKGDMSLAGPRPLLAEYLPLYNAFQKRRHDVRPGITGWAQVNGRNAISWKEKFEYDVWYIDNLSFWLDIKIFWLTIIKIFKPEGISSGTSQTMEKFTGN